MTTSINTGTEQLLASQDGGILTLTLNRPEARNALSDDLSPALRAMLAQTAKDDNIGALIITGAGTAFCAGCYVKGLGGKLENPCQRKSISPTCSNASGP